MTTYLRKQLSSSRWSGC